jgi:hypothetical protein
MRLVFHKNPFFHICESVEEAGSQFQISSVPSLKYATQNWLSF